MNIQEKLFHIYMKFHATVIVVIFFLFGIGLGNIVSFSQFYRSVLLVLSVSSSPIVSSALGYSYLSEERTTDTARLAIKWFKHAAMAGDADAAAQAAALRYDPGVAGVGVDDMLMSQEFDEFVKQAADANHPYGLRLLGRKYLWGKSGEGHEAKGKLLMRKAFEGGSLKAAFDLGTFLWEKRGGAAMDQEALYWFWQAGRKGEYYAQDKLADIYSDQGSPLFNAGKAKFWVCELGNQHPYPARRKICKSVDAEIVPDLEPPLLPIAAK